VDFGPCANALLKPLRYPCINVRASFRRAHANLSACVHTIDLKKRNVRNAQASIYG
jgi:hypothetical protein